MSPDSSYGGRYEPAAPASTESYMPHREREPELHIGLFSIT